MRIHERAWSRAGAVAAVLSTGPRPRALPRSARLALLVGGSLLIAGSVAVTLWTELGPGPLDVFIGAVRNVTGLPLSVAVWVTIGSSIAVAWILGRRPGLGTVLSPLLIGPMLQGVLAALGTFAAPSSILALVALQVVAIVGIGLGAGALIVSGLGAGPGELFAGAASDRTGRPESLVRAGIELSWVALGVALGGPIGVGTVMVAVMIGPAVTHGHRAVDGVAGVLLPGSVGPGGREFGVVGDTAVVAEHHEAIEATQEPAIMSDRDDGAVELREAVLERLG